jgi:CRP-like cAMP-binding protein
MYTPLQNAGRSLWRMYRRVFRRQADARVRGIAEVLAQSPAFAGCSAGTCLELADAMHPRTYGPDAYLYYEGDPGLGLYIVQEGRVRLIAEADDATYELRQLGPGGVFGECSLLGDFQRLETAQTLSEARVLGFFRPDLVNLTKRNPRAGAEVTQALAQYVIREHRTLVRFVGEQSTPHAALRAYAEAAARTASLDSGAPTG